MKWLKKIEKGNILKMINRAITRAVFGFFAFIPFCMWWGVESFTLFSFLGTLYFVPVHYVFDKLVKKDAR